MKVKVGDITYDKDLLESELRKSSEFISFIIKPFIEKHRDLVDNEKWTKLLDLYNTKIGNCRLLLDVLLYSDIDILKDAREIPEYLFAFNEVITEVHINDSIVEIAHSAFYQTRFLEKVSGMKNVSYIGNTAFYQVRGHQREVIEYNGTRDEFVDIFDLGNKKIFHVFNESCPLDIKCSDWKGTSNDLRDYF